MIFKALLLLILGASFLYALILPKQALLRKIFILAFLSVMIVFSFNPDAATKVANLVGIGRGADFLFYLSHLVLFFIAFIYYLKFKHLEIQFSTLIRHIAIMEAQNPSAAKINTDGQKGP